MGVFEAIIIVFYIFATGYLGYLGYRHTKTSTDYMLAGREIHPMIMALSYGATFISTSAIVGFGGVAGIFGMNLLWLVFLNIFMGILIAFVFLGEPTRAMGRRLGAHTFPELLGKRFQSRFIQIFSGAVIFFFMPLYTTAVLLGGAEFVQTIFHIDNFTISLLILALVVGAYVLAGGLKGVMYNDALQGCVMFIGMMILIFLTYRLLGGMTEAHKSLTDMAHLVPDNLRAIGHRGWTSTPEFGWGDKSYNMWWVVFSTITMGVGIGVLAQPQMAVRFMTVKSRREMNRAVAVGGIFILLLPGVVYSVGALSNVYFYEKEEIQGKILHNDEANKKIVILPEGAADESFALTIPVNSESEIILGQNGNPDIVRPRAISIARTGGRTDKIIPTYIDRAMPRWFGIIFLLTLLSAAISTLSSQLHAMGTSAGRDIFEQIAPRYKPTDRATITITRVGIMIGLIVSIILAAKPLRDYIAISTALFFGLCASAFLPAFFGALFWKRMTKFGAILSIVGGFIVSGFWMLFFYSKTAGGIGLCMMLTGKTTLLTAPNWPVVDPIAIGLPISILLAVTGSLLSKPPESKHIDKCFEIKRNKEK
jgi:SSS family solute:Na+ symporter